MRPALLASFLLAPGLVFGAARRVAAHDAPYEEIAELTEELAQRPHDVALLLERAEIWLQERNPERAADDLSLARTLDPDADIERSSLLWADMWMQRGRPAEAEAELDRAVDRGSLAALARRAEVRETMERWTAALADYDAVLARRVTVEMALGRGRVLERLGRADEAAAGYARDAARLGGAVPVRLARVATLRGLGRFDDALQEVQRVMDRSPVKTRWLLLRGDLLEAAGRADLARAARELALGDAERMLRRRRSLAARLHYARALLANGRRTEARDQLVRVQSASPALASQVAALLGVLGGDQ